MVNTGIAGAGVVIIAIVRITVGKTPTVGAEFVGLAIGVTLAFVAGDADTAKALFVHVATIIRNTHAHPGEAGPPVGAIAAVTLDAADAVTAGAYFAGCAVGIRIALEATPLVDAGLGAEAILFAIARDEHGFTRAIVAMFVGVTIGVTLAFNAISVDADFVGIAGAHTRIDGITAVCEDHRSAKQKDTNPI